MGLDQDVGYVAEIKWIKTIKIDHKFCSRKYISKKINLNTLQRIKTK